jgi:hypothetical protein
MLVYMLFAATRYDQVWFHLVQFFPFDGLIISASEIIKVQTTVAIYQVGHNHQLGYYTSIGAIYTKWGI